MSFYRVLLLVVLVVQERVQMPLCVPVAGAKVFIFAQMAIEERWGGGGGKI